MLVSFSICWLQVWLLFGLLVESFPISVCFFGASCSAPFLLAGFRFGFFSSCWLNPSPIVFDVLELHVWLLVYLLASGLASFRLAG